MEIVFAYGIIVGWAMLRFVASQRLLWKRRLHATICFIAGGAISIFFHTVVSQEGGVLSILIWYAAGVALIFFLSFACRAIFRDVMDSAGLL